MWFSSVYLKTLRDFRVPILGWGLGLGLLMTAVLAAVPTLLATPEARASIVALGPSFAWFAEPVKIDTAGGYATWKYGLTVLVVVLWPILAMSGTLRGEEERGSLDVLLSLPRGRFRAAIEKVAAMWTALLLMALLIGLLAFAGARKASVDLGVGDTIAYGLNLAVIAALFGSIALLLSQFTSERRTAAGWTAGLLLVFIVLDMVHRVVPNTLWVSQLSPVYYFNLSKPLISGYGFNLGAMAFLLALSIGLTGLATGLFVRRDVGGVVLTRRQRETVRAGLPEGDWSLRSVYSRGLAMVTVPTFWWTLAIAGFAAWMVVVVKQTEGLLKNLFQGSAFGADILKAGGGDVATNTTILSLLFVFLPLLLMAFAVTQASRWASDEEDGRFEILLSTPQSRLSVLLGRFAALSTATVVICVVTLATAAVASVATGIALDGGKLVGATLSMIPLGLLIAAIGYLASGWVRAAVDTGLISFLLLIWFFISFIGPGLNWPEATLRLSAFYYYGSPLLHGIQPADLLVIVAVAAAALAVGSLRFVRKDISV
ncbi:MAG TPA: ABC transporter permease subunit [Candidatus Dormibacteraeota bacterium]